MTLIYITGHRNPDTDSIASAIAIGYAELKRRLDPSNDYRAVRLGDCNAQTRWLLERAGAEEPSFLRHVLPRARDVMQTSFPVTGQAEPLREAGLAMGKADLELVPIVDDHGALTGAFTERALARRYIRESRRTSTLEEAPTYVSAVVSVLEGRLVTGGDRQLAGRVWVQSMDVETDSGTSDGDVVVVGNRADAQRLAIDLGAALVVLSNSAQPTPEVVTRARCSRLPPTSPSSAPRRSSAATPSATRGGASRRSASPRSRSWAAGCSSAGLVGRSGRYAEPTCAPESTSAPTASDGASPHSCSSR